MRIKLKQAKIPQNQENKKYNSEHEAQDEYYKNENEKMINNFNLE